MKTLLLVATTLLAAPLAHAEKFTCSFTEPFYTVTYDTATETLGVKDDVMNKAREVHHVKFQIVDAGNFVLKTAKGKLLGSLKLTHEGSDGMSDTIYPYAVTMPGIQGANNGEGGCSSSLLPTREGNP